MPTAQRLISVFAFFVLCLFVGIPAFAQTETATLSGVIQDPKGEVVPDVEVTATRIETGTAVTTRTNGAGIYFFTGLVPGHYHLIVRRPGFKEIAIKEFQLNVQDKLEQNFSLEIGSVSESVTVNADEMHMNTTDATVSTLVDRQFAENLPLNGRSFQSLLYLTPGVIPTSAGGYDSGQFSVNGQRAASNYWMVDGVSANVASSSFVTGNQLAGAAGVTSVFGGTNSLVSVDAMQEFRIQTSTFAPEYGRTPGAQISIVTRSGGNAFHGSMFDYLRNDIFDANNWFNGVNILNSTPLPKAQERQNDFGGTFSGPILRKSTFFFFSYEGLRLRLPMTKLSTVPDAGARQTAAAALQPFLNAFPLDPIQSDLTDGRAQFNASYSNPGTLNDYSIRIDHKLSDKFTVFGRYNNSPSEISERGSGITALSDVSRNRSVAQQLTIGSSWSISPRLVDELRFNYSRTNASGTVALDNFGGAVPLSSAPFPNPFTLRNSFFTFAINNLSQEFLQAGSVVRNLQRQFNVVNNVTAQIGSHGLKFGVDYRRLTPVVTPDAYVQTADFRNVVSAENGQLRASFLNSNVGATILFQNVSVFAQDTWALAPRLTLTYGVRWDTDFPPSSLSGPSFDAVAGFSSLNDLSQLTLAPTGTPAFRNSLGNIAPRIGAAYQISQKQDRATVLRGGFGVFYDLATSEAANIIVASSYPFNAFAFSSGGTFPLSPQAATPPAIVAPSATNPERISAFDPNLKLPFTLEWNAAVQQGLGSHQALSITYLGSVGRRIIQTASVLSPTPAFNQFQLVTNGAESNYNALQLQFERRMYKNLQALVSYTWSHSIDNASAGSVGNAANVPAGPGNSGNRGSSDFDLRHAFSAGFTYAIPSFNSDAVSHAVTSGWSLQSIIQAQSARPVVIVDNNLNNLVNGFTQDIRPDVLPGIPLYLYGPQYPGGKAINNTPGAPGSCPNGSASLGPFCDPPGDVANGGPALRQGNLPRNSLRGFGFTQWDCAIHREFAIRESVKLQFRAEIFNVLNHPNFGPPQGNTFLGPQFGIANQTLGNYLNGGSLGSGGFSSLYQIGGPRSMQFALKLSF